MSHKSDQIENKEEYLLEYDPIYFGSKKNFLIILGYIASILYGAYSIVNLLVGDYWAFALELILSLTAVSSLISLNKSRKMQPAVNIGLLTGIAIMWQNFFSGGFENTGIFWIYIAPLMIFFLVGAREGLKWNALMNLGFLLIFLLSKLGLVDQHYTNFTLLMFAFSILLMTFIVYQYQLSIEKHGAMLIESNRRIEELNNLREKFIKIVSHQLRTPLSVSRWNIETLLDDESIEKNTKDKLKSIYNALLNATGKMADMLKAIEIKEGNIILNESKFEVRELVEEIVHELEKAYTPRKLDFELGHKNIHIQADKEKVEFILRTIIKNAFKYTKRNAKIEVKIRKEKDRVVVSVTDNGIGIPDNDASKIFQLFSRADNAVKNYPNASGVSLYVSKVFMELHGGDIRFTSIEGIGSTFRIIFPRERVLH